MLFSLKRTFSSLTYILKLEKALLVCFTFVCFLSSLGCALPNYQTLGHCSTGVCIVVIAPASLRQWTGSLVLASVEAHTTSTAPPHPTPSCLEQLNFCLKILHAYSFRRCIQQTMFSFSISGSKHSLKVKQVGKCLASCSLRAQLPATATPQCPQVWN